MAHLILCPRIVRAFIVCLCLCGCSPITLYAAGVIETDTAQNAIPTRIDQIGRIVIPVFLNNRDPFRLMLDTGATHSVITHITAQRLNVDVTGALIAPIQGVMS